MVPEEGTAAPVSYLRSTMKLAALSLKLTFGGADLSSHRKVEGGLGPP